MAVPRTPNKIDITVTLLFNSFFQSKIQKCIFLYVFVHLYSVVSHDSKVNKSASLFFSYWLLLTLVVWLTIGDLFVSQNLRGVCASHSSGSILSCAFTIGSFGQIYNFLHNSHGITFPNQSCLILYSLSASLLHLFIMWLIVSSMSTHNLQLLFCWILSILALIWMVFIAFWAAIWRDSVSIIQFPSLNHVLISHEICRFSVA